MKLTILSAIIFLSVNCFGQQSQNAGPAIIDTGVVKSKSDSSAIKVISIKEFEAYLQRINQVAMKQFDLTEKAKYDKIFEEIRSVFIEADKKRKGIK